MTTQKKYDNTAFKANINGIHLPQKTKDEITLLSNELNKVIGHEVHHSETPIGTSKAIFSKWINAFRIDIDDDTSVMVSTYLGKIHSFFLHHRRFDKEGRNVLSALDMYNGCKTAQNPVPHIKYSELIDHRILDKYDAAYEPNDTISAKDSKKIENLISIVSKKLGLK